MFEALRFSGPNTQPLAQLKDAEWRKLLAFCDRAQLSLPLGLRCRPQMPEWVQGLLDRKFADNAERWRKIQEDYRQVSQAFDAAGLDFLVLKGFSQCPEFVDKPAHRAQYDLDLLLPKEQARQAQSVAIQLGYEPIGNSKRFPIDHLPAMVRKTGWEWRGNHFDPDLPLSLELHFRLWDQETERIPITGLEQFWERRERRCLEGLRFTALNKLDAVAYSSLHLLRHLLRGDLRPSHVYELGWFLDNGCPWLATHDDSLRRPQAICFALAHEWFGCRLSEAAAEEIERLPSPVHRWLSHYAFSPLASFFQPNKDELWLHLSLLDSGLAQAAVLRRRLLPISLPGPVDAVHIQSSGLTAWIRLRRAWRYGRFLAQRFGHHAGALPGLLPGGIRWTFWSVDFSRQYWRFFIAAGLFDFGLFIYFLLYNLYLLRIGFDEKFLGLVSGAMLAGSIAGSIPAAIAIERFGVRNTLLVGFVLVACTSIVRANVASGPALLALAFIAGLTSSVWAVAISPAVAQLTTARNRSLGFSLVFSSGIGIGIAGGLVGGRLPGWLAGFSGVPLTFLQYRQALVAGSVIVLFAAWPLAGLQLGSAGARVGLRRPTPALTRFLAAAAVWNLGTGAFNPFFSAFFARLSVPVETIGAVFSGAQLMQVAAILLAPLALRRFGLVRGISGMQLLTGGALLSLAAAVNPATAALGYGAFMVFQYMSEPGMYTLLMDSVPPSGRSGASALNFLVASSAQAVAAALAGALIGKLGYPRVLIGASLVCIVAGLLFHLLLGGVKAPGKHKAATIHPE